MKGAYEQVIYETCVWIVPKYLRPYIEHACTHLSENAVTTATEMQRAAHKLAQKLSA